MATPERAVSRRAFLAGGLAAGALLAGRGMFQTAGAASQTGIVAKSVTKAPIEPDDVAWEDVTSANVQLFPQNVVVPRLAEAGAKSIAVRALYDAERISVLLEWSDPNQDVNLGTVSQFRDGAAIEFPEDPSAQLPPFTMGMAGNAVLVYHWKSDWQFGRDYDVENAYPNMYTDGYQYSGVAVDAIPKRMDYLTKGDKTYLTAAAAGNALADPRLQESIGPVEKMRAEGFGTIEPHGTQDAQGQGLWKDGVWRVVVSVPRQQEKFTFAEETPYNLAFALWDGGRKERNGLKAYSIWQTLGLGHLPEVAPIGVEAEASNTVPLFGGIAAAALAAAAGAAALARFRQRGKQGESKKS